MKEEERVLAEKRGLSSVRYQKWENGVGGQQVRLALPVNVFANLLTIPCFFFSGSVERGNCDQVTCETELFPPQNFSEYRLDREVKLDPIQHFFSQYFPLDFS